MVVMINYCFYNVIELRVANQHVLFYPPSTILAIYKKHCAKDCINITADEYGNYCYFIHMLMMFKKGGTRHGTIC